MKPNLTYVVALDPSAGVGKDAAAIEAFQNKIIPLLQEYFFGDFGKIALVLGKGFLEMTEPAQEKFFAELYPHLRDDELRLLAELNSKDDIKQLAKAHGWDDKRIKSDL